MRIPQPKGRFVLPTLFGDEDLRALERTKDRHSFGTLRFVLAGVWQLCDSKGRFRWSMDVLYHHITWGDITKSRFKRLIELLLEHRYIHRYNEQGEFDTEGKYCHVRTWSKYQWTDSRESEFVTVPCPCEKDKPAAPVRGAKGKSTAQDVGKRKPPAEPQSDCQICHGWGNFLLPNGRPSVCDCAEQ